MINHNLLLFDLDGTLVDSCLDLTTAVNLTLAEYGLEPLTVEKVTSFIGDGSRQLMARCLAEADADLDVDVDDATDRLGVNYGEHLLDQTHLYDGIIPLLEAATQEGYRLAVVTNKIEASARKVVAGLGIERFFDLVLGDDGKRKLKPAPDLILEALSKTDCTPEMSWMLGDNHTDLAAGRAAEVRTCFCRYGFGRPHSESSDLAISSPAEFSEYLCANLNYSDKS